MSKTAIASQSENRDCWTVSFKKPSMRYFDEFLQLHCAPDLLAWELYPNSKEITESMSAYSAVRKYLWPRWKPDDTSIEVFCVGDGCTPRTAALFALRSKWVVYSIDPNLREETKSIPIDRLHIRPYKIEALTLTDATRPKRSIVVAIHSHADLQMAYKVCHGKDETAVIAMRCCVPQNLACPPDEIYEDFGVWSPHRTVQVWKSIRVST